MKMKKSLGQNFLQDEYYISKIIDSFELNENDTVLEIGPGGGILTKNIVNRVKKLYAVEIDQRLLNNLRETLPNENFTLFHEDFMKFNYSDNIKGSDVKIVGNLPYHITSGIIFKVMDLAAELNQDIKKIKSLTIMIQKEVAERIVGKVNTKKYGIITVLTSFFSSPEILFDVPPTAFFPKPKVTSTIIRFNFSEKIENINKVKNFAFFKKIVKATFLNRRKMLRNTLKPFVEDVNDIKSVDITKRPENISVEEFINLANEIIPK